MGEAVLATSGDTIKLWNASSYAFYQEISSEIGHVNGLAWNQDGQCLASLGDSGKEIGLSAVCGKSETNIGVIRGIESPSCLSFACRSPHYLGVGSASGTITIWNVKSQTKKKAFAPTDQAIARVAFSHSDSHIAAATTKGSLHMLSITNNLTTGPFQLFNKQAVTDLAYSRVKKSLLGCCCDRGAVTLFDTNASKVVHSFPSAHSCPVAAIAFSPINELLMVSVGYDKKLCCFNVQTRLPVMSHISTAPLTSVTFLGTGQLVALGTMTGQVLIHDMRNINTPVATLKAHKAAVTNVLLQPRPKSKSVSSSKTSQKNTNTTATLAPPSQRPAKSCSDQPSELSPELRAKSEATPDPRELDLSVFSPIRNTNPPPPHAAAAVDQIEIIKASGSDCLQYLQTDPSMEGGIALSVFSPIRTTDVQQPSHYVPFSHTLMDINEGNLLSPVRDTNLTIRSDSVNSESPAAVKVHTPMEVSAPENITDKENIEPLVQLSTEQSSQKKTSQHSVTPTVTDVSGTDKPSTTSYLPQETVMNSPGPTQRGTPQGRPGPKRQPSTMSPEDTHMMPLPSVTVSSAAQETSKKSDSSISTNVPVATSAPPSTMPFTSPSRLSPPKKRQLLNLVEAFDLAPDTQPTQPVDAAMPVPNVPAAGHTPSQLQMELIRSCMVDVVEEFYDDLKSRMIHLQYIMTKKFIEQEEVMKQLHRQYSLNEDLMKEVERLQLENERLKSNY